MRAINTFVLLCALIIATLGACAWGEGSPGGGGDDDQGPGPAPTPVCGDGTCAPAEVGKCTADCGGGGQAPKCGNGSCENGESNANCPGDCPSQSQCGNGTCDAGETTGNCAQDCPAMGNCPADPVECFFCASFGQLCPAGHDMNSCFACILGGGGGTCAGGFPDGTCDMAAGENSQNCPFDCM
jgi:hypothetical protein